MSARNPRSQRYKYSVWHLSSDVPESATLAEHLDWAVTTRRSLPQPLPDDARTDVFVGVFLQRGMGEMFELTATDAASLASAGLAVVFDVYGSEGENEEQDR